MKEFPQASILEGDSPTSAMVVDLRRSLARTRGENVTLRAELRAVWDRTNAAEGHAATLTGKVDGLDRQVDTLTSQLVLNENLRTNQFHTIDELQADVEAGEEQLEHATEANADLRYAASLSRKLIDELQADVEKRDQDLENVRNDYAGNIHILDDYKAALTDTQQVLRAVNGAVDSIALELGLNPMDYTLRSLLVAAILQKVATVETAADTTTLSLQAEYAPYYNTTERASLESFDQAVEDYHHELVRNYKGE